MNRLNLNLSETRKFLGAVGMHFDIKKCIVALLTILLTYFFLGDVYLYLMIQGTDGKMPMDYITNTNNSLLCTPQPFCHLDMKSLLLDLPNFYVYHPLSIGIYKWTKFGTNFSFISANVVSIFHVLLAMISAKCISNDSLCIRRIGVGFFALRNFLDAFDGTVARASRNEIVGFNSASVGSTGYWIDGLADGLGTIFLFFGCLFYILKHPLRNYKQQFAYSPLPLVILNKSGNSSNNDDHHHQWERDRDREPTTTTINSSSSTSPRSYSTTNNNNNNTCGLHSGLQPVILGIQCVINSMCWNRYIAMYSRLLQENYYGPSGGFNNVRIFQGHVVKSSMMWVVIIMWRLFNVHSILEMLIAAIFFDKMVEFMTFVQLLGFIPLGMSVFLSEVHLNDVQTYLNSKCTIGTSFSSSSSSSSSAS